MDTSGALAGKTVTSITAGGGHTCAIADGRAYCWGANGFGDLGNNSTTNSWVPVAVDTSGVLHNKSVTAISAGGMHTCAIADGRAYCWGDNQYGPLGKPGARGKVPVAVDTRGSMNNDTVTAISAGGADIVCGRQRPGLLLGQRWGGSRLSVHPLVGRLAGTGRGGHRRCAGRQGRHGDQRRHGSRTGPDRASPTADQRRDWRESEGAKGRVKVTWNAVAGADLLPVADLEAGREDVQGLEDHHQDGVQGQGEEGQEVPLPSRLRWYAGGQGRSPRFGSKASDRADSPNISSHTAPRSPS